MDERETQRYAPLCQQLIELLWAGDFDGLAALLAADASLLLPKDVARAQGKAQALAALTSLHKKLSSRMAPRCETLAVRDLGDGVCLATFQLHVASVDGGGSAHVSERVAAAVGSSGTTAGERHDHRSPILCSLVWTTGKDGTPQLQLCHCSLAPSAALGSMAGQLAQTADPISGKLRGAGQLALQACDAAGTTHWVTSDQVVYVAAAHQYTNVYCRDRLVRLRASFASVLQQLGDVVVRVHRSYAVNPLYVSRLEGEMLHLVNGAKVPVPAKRVRQVRQELATRSQQLGARV